MVDLSDVLERFDGDLCVEGVGEGTPIESRRCKRVLGGDFDKATRERFDLRMQELDLLVQRALAGRD